MSLAMNEAEQRQIDSQVEQMMDWAKANEAEAEQLAMDSARIMACTSERMDSLANQGFFKRCWSRFSGEAGSMERANTKDLIQIQKCALRYINMLQEHDVLMAHSIISLKNDLYSLTIKEDATRNLISLLAEKTSNKFSLLEKRLDQVEISSNLQGWLLGLEERDYTKKIPTKYMRLFRIINDFYGIKNDNWNINDLLFMGKAIRTVGIDPKEKISLNEFIDELIMEIIDDNVGLGLYDKSICECGKESIDNYSEFAVENISSPIFVSIHGLKINFEEKLDVINSLYRRKSFFNFMPSKYKVLKDVLLESIEKLNVNMNYSFPLAETAIEILGCMRLVEKLTYHKEDNGSRFIDNDDDHIYKKDRIDVVEQKKVDNNKIEKEILHEKFNINLLAECEWKKAEDVPLGYIQDIQFCDNKFIISFLKEEVNGRISRFYTTEDFNSWDYIASIKSDVEKFKVHNNSFFAASYGNIIYSDNIKDLSDDCIYNFGSLDLDAIDLEIIYTNSKFHLFFRRGYGVNYKQKGRIFNSDKVESLSTYKLLNFKNRDECDEFSFTNNYSTYLARSWCINTKGDRIAVLLSSPYISDNRKPVNNFPYGKKEMIITSNDGYTWETIYKNEDEKKISDIFSFDNKLFGLTMNRLYALDNNRNFIPFVENDIFNNGVHVFNDLGLVMCYHSDQLNFTTDFRNWRNISCPSSLIITYGNNLFVQKAPYDDYNRILKGYERQIIFYRNVL